MDSPLVQSWFPELASLPAETASRIWREASSKIPRVQRILVGWTGYVAVAGPAVLGASIACDMLGVSLLVRGMSFVAGMVISVQAESIAVEAVFRKRLQRYVRIAVRSYGLRVCIECGYNIAASRTRCPECGAECDPDGHGT